mmetsp:Transcript_54328/g.172547  ORF Transcript_54328/g.172547 Transcript_54328/m.172547 type:complete len:593 (-) Transcript_54328:334-2112(-)
MSGRRGRTPVKAIFDSDSSDDEPAAAPASASSRPSAMRPKERFHEDVSSPDFSPVPMRSVGRPLPRERDSPHSPPTAPWPESIGNGSAPMPGRGPSPMRPSGLFPSRTPPSGAARSINGDLNASAGAGFQRGISQSPLTSPLKAMGTTSEDGVEVMARIYQSSMGAAFGSYANSQGSGQKMRDRPAAGSSAEPLSPSSLERRLARLEGRLSALPSPGAVPDQRTSQQVSEVVRKLAEVELKISGLSSGQAAGQAKRSQVAEEGARESQARLQALEAEVSSVAARGAESDRRNVRDVTACLDDVANLQAALARAESDRGRDREGIVDDFGAFRRAIEGLDERLQAMDARAASGAVEQACISHLEEAMGGGAEGLMERLAHMESQLALVSSQRESLESGMVDCMARVSSLQSRSPGGRALGGDGHLAAALAELEARVAEVDERAAWAAEAAGGAAKQSEGGGAGGAALSEISERLAAVEAACNGMGVTAPPSETADPRIEELEERYQELWSHVVGDEGEAVKEGGRSGAARAVQCVAILLLLFGLASVGVLAWVLLSREGDVVSELEEVRDCAVDLAEQYVYPQLGWIDGIPPT